MDPNTRNAIKKFQKAQKIKEDGKTSEDLLERLDKAVASLDEPVLEPPVTVEL